MPDIAELGLSIDTRQLEQGAQAMDRLGAASQSVEKKVDSATSAIDKLGKASADAKGKTAEGAAAVDAVGEAGARVVQKVDAATASIDAMGATATRIRTVFLGGSNTLDGFMGSSMGVWRSSEAAAAGIDSLGNATERTWKKQADYNGAMADTTRIMRQAADAARTLEESNHRMLIELQREIDTFGMARGELERYRAAELGLGSAAQTKAAALGNSIDAMHREERAARDAAGAQDRAAAAGDRFIKSLQDQVATLGMSTQQLQAYRAAQLGVSDAAAPLINKLAETGEGAKKAGGHMEGFSFQSASAKRELLVLAHELSQGQFQRFGGSMMVLGEQTGAAGLLFSSTGLAVLGFAAALGTVAYAMIKGASTQREMNNALISTNNYAGVTSDKLNELAHAATAVHGSIGEAKKVVTELAGTGKFTGEQIAYITDAVIALETATGESVKKTIKEFESLAVQSTGSTNRATEVITRATVKLDDTYHFLTLSVYEAIRALEKDGDAKGASAVATEAFAKATKDGADQMIANLGSVARAWHGVKEAIGGAMDAIGSYGAKATPAADVKKYSFRLSEFDKGLADSNLRLGRAPDAITPELQVARTQIVLGLTDAVDKLNKADAVAIAQGEIATKNSRAVHAAAMIHAEDIRLQKKGMGELAVALDAYQSNIDAIRAADPNSPLITPDAIAAGIAARKKAHTDQAKPKADQVENTELADQLKQYAKEAATAKAHYDELGKLDDMYLRAGELSERQFYENKRSYALSTYEAQIDAFDLEIGALKGHNSVTKAEAAKHEKALNEILGKRSTAEKAFFDESFRRDEEERLRKAAVVTASNDAMNKYISSINQEAQKIEDSNHIHEKARSVIEREEVARLDLAIAYQKQFIEGQAAAGATAEEIAQAPAILKYLEDQRAARLRLAQGLDQQDQVKLAQAQIETNKKMWETIDSTAQDTFVSIGNSGISAVDRVWGALKNGLFAWLYQMTLKKWIINIGASMTGANATSMAMAGDLSGIGGAGGVAGSVGAAANLLQSAKTAYTIASQGFAGITAGLGTSVVSLGTLFGSTAIEAFGAGLGSTGLVGAADAAGLYAASGGVGSAGAVTAGAYAGAAVTAAAGIAAGVLGGRMISGQYGSNSTVNAGTGIGAVAGAFMGGPVGAAIGGALGGVIGGIGNRIFGMGDKKYGETGITGTLSGTGFTGNEYAKWTQKGGWLRSDKKDTDRKAVDATTSNAFVETYAAIRNVSATLAYTLGVDTTSLAARAQVLNINLTGLTTDADRLGAVTKFFEGVGNAIALELVPSLGQFRVGNEELSTTLQRVSQDYVGVDAVLQLIGRTSQDAFGAVGVATIGARENLIKLAGSLDSLSSGTSFFAQNFLTEAEQMAPVLSTVAKTLATLGMAGATTMDDYKKKVLGLNLASEADQELYIKLLALAPAFKAASEYSNQLAAATGNYTAVVKTASEIASERMDLQKQLNELTKSDTELLAIQRASIAEVNRGLFDLVQAEKAAAAARDTAAKNLVTAKDALTSAYQAESSAAQSALDKVKSWVSSLKSMSAGLALGNLSTLTPEQKYAEARAQFEKTLAAARGGDAEAQSGLSAAEQAFLTASQLVNASSTKYVEDYALVQAANAEALKYAAAQVNMQQASLDALKAQVSGLITVNASVLTVAQAIDGLRAAMGVATRLGVPFDGSHAGGLVSVPFNGYAAELHQGEVVVDAAAAAAMRRYFGGAPSQGGGNTDALVAEIRALREENKATREELRGLRADQARQTGDIILGNYDASDKAANKQVAGAKSAAMAPIYAEKMRAKLA